MTAKHKVFPQLTCFLTTRFLTPSMANSEAVDMSLANIPTVFVPPPLYAPGITFILVYVLFSRNSFSSVWNLKSSLLAILFCVYSLRQRKLNIMSYLHLRTKLMASRSQLAACSATQYWSISACENKSTNCNDLFNIFHQKTLAIVSTFYNWNSYISHGRSTY